MLLSPISALQPAAHAPVLRITDRGLYCAAADLYIDPWLPVDRAVITHAHGDHARGGSQHYLASRDGARVDRTRGGDHAAKEQAP